MVARFWHSGHSAYAVLNSLAIAAGLVSSMFSASTTADRDALLSLKTSCFVVVVVDIWHSSGGKWSHVKPKYSGRTNRTKPWILLAILCFFPNALVVPEGSETQGKTTCSSQRWGSLDFVSAPLLTLCKLPHSVCLTGHPAYTYSVDSCLPGLVKGCSRHLPEFMWGVCGTSYLSEQMSHCMSEDLPEHMSKVKIRVGLMSG